MAKDLSAAELRELRLRCTPVNREKMEHNIHEIYRLMKWAKPQQIIYHNGPWNVELNRSTERRWRSALLGDVSSPRVQRIITTGDNSRIRRVSDPFLGSYFQTGWGASDAYLVVERLIQRARQNDEMGLLLREILGEAVVVTFGLTAHVFEKPLEIHFNADNQLHNVDGPSIIWRNGRKVYHFNGVSVPQRFVEGPITVAYINQQPNAERRRVLIERFGPGEYLKKLNARLDAEDEYGKLWRVPNGGGTVRKTVKEKLWGGNGFVNRSRQVDVREDLCFVELQNSSAEPDGSYKTYFLRVPPKFRSPKAAIAWTFGVRDYEPKVMT